LSLEEFTKPSAGPRTEAWLLHVPRYYLGYSLLFAVSLVWGIFGLSQIETSIQIMRLFAPGTPIIASYAWLEEHLGAMVPMEVVIQFDQRSEREMASRLQLVRRLHEQINDVPIVSGCLSAATFTPDLRSTGRSVRSVVTGVRLRQARQQLMELGYLYADSQGESWRISVRARESEELDGGQFEQQLRGVIEPILAKRQESREEELHALYTGAVPIIYKARRSLLDGLTLGFATDVLLVVITVVILIRSLSGGVLLLLTSVFPVVVVFGLMGWMDWKVDIGSMMTPCVALGVSIDDAIHFVLWFRRGITDGLGRRQAVALAYSGCGRAMIQSWGVIGVGLSVFALSPFVPTFRFGALILALLTAALVCNLVFLPALLAGPLGGLLAAGVRRQSHLVRAVPAPKTSTFGMRRAAQRK
jgi:predicted RND superfamily exporter protein